MRSVAMKRISGKGLAGLDKAKNTVGWMAGMLYLYYFWMLFDYFQMMRPGEEYLYKGTAFSEALNVGLMMCFYALLVAWLVCWLILARRGRATIVGIPFRRLGRGPHLSARILGAVCVLIWLLVQVPLFLATIQGEVRGDMVVYHGSTYQNPLGVLIVCFVLAAVVWLVSLLVRLMKVSKPE